MKKSTFFLIMAIIWTVVAFIAVEYVLQTGTGSLGSLILLLAFVAVAGNWLRWYRSR